MKMCISSRKTLVLLLLSVALLTQHAPRRAIAQKKSVRPGINKSFENPDVAKFVERFEREGREVFEKRREIIAACELKPGMAVADIGAGTGLFTSLLATGVGDKGRVYAVDIAPKFVDHVVKKCRDGNLTNVVGVVCRADSCQLPANSIDLAFVCDTYHHFEFPYKTMRSIHRALRPGGRVVLIDFQRIPGVSSPWIMGHVRAGKETFTKEIIDSGFELTAEKKLFRENYFCLFRKRARNNPADRPAVEISPAKRDQHGVLIHDVHSSYQAATTKIKVLLPENYKKDQRYRVLYVLPVEAGEGARYGDGMLECVRNDLHNKHDLICVLPTFSHLPWYADHPSDPDIRQESYFLKVVVPFIEKTYPVQAAPQGRLLVGFSKSGWGAFSLLLRHPDQFARAAAWDAPMTMTAPGRYGNMPIFADQENFDRYRIDWLLKDRQKELQQRQRLILLGYGGFRKQHQQIHQRMNELGILHLYRDGPSRKHIWGSGWLSEAVEHLVRKTGGP